MLEIDLFLRLLILNKLSMNIKLEIELTITVHYYLNCTFSYSNDVKIN